MNKCLLVCNLDIAKHLAYVGSCNLTMKSKVLGSVDYCVTTEILPGVYFG